MEWTKDVPTQEGKYLLWIEGDAEPYLGTVEYDCGGLGWTLDNTSPHVSWTLDVLPGKDNAYWLGPIELPMLSVAGV